MATVTWNLEQADLFPEGTKVEVTPRFTEQFGGPGGNVTAKATVNKQGVAKLSGLTADAPYWAYGDVEVPDPANPAKRTTRTHSIAFTPLSRDALAHPDLRSTPEETTRRRIAEAEAATEARRQAEKKDPLAASPAPGRTVEPNRVTGSRSSRDVSTRVEPEPKPGPRQQDTSGVVQRSDTIDGEATPKDARELVPGPAQDDVPKRQLQRSSTEQGEATPKDRDEQVPSARQEDVPSGTVQRSDTATGEAEPKPRKGRAKTAPKKERDSAAQRARGRTPAKPERKVRPKGRKKTVSAKTGASKRKTTNSNRRK